MSESRRWDGWSHLAHPPCFPVARFPVSLCPTGTSTSGVAAIGRLCKFRSRYCRTRSRLGRHSRGCPPSAAGCLGDPVVLLADPVVCWCLFAIQLVGLVCML